jgi:hypothetical protein
MTSAESFKRLSNFKWNLERVLVLTDNIIATEVEERIQNLGKGKKNEAKKLLISSLNRNPAFPASDGQGALLSDEVMYDKYKLLISLSQCAYKDFVDAKETKIPIITLGALEIRELARTASTHEVEDFASSLTAITDILIVIGKSEDDYKNQKSTSESIEAMINSQ